MRILNAIVWSILFVATSMAQNVEVREEILENGMKLLMVERHESPRIAAGWVARVGSVDEQLGITGMSHLFEHMMFKGTHTIGISDSEKETEIQARQDEIRKQMEEEYSKLREKLRKGEISGNIYDPSNRTPRLQELRSQLEELFQEEKKLIVKDELDQIYTREGAAGLNAGTTHDQTIYFVDIPSNKLELWFWLESDRLLNPVFREFYSERDVVREERRLRTESTPTGQLDELFNAMFWQSSPYQWPIVGWPSDVESITRQQAEEFYSVYYAPNNLTAVLVGDFASEHAVELAREYFGRIPRGVVAPPEVLTAEVPQIAEKRFVGEAETNPQVTIRYHAVPFNHQDEFALELLADILSGRTGRLYQSLVEEKQVAVGQPGASLQTMKYEGFFEIGAQVKEGVSPEVVESALLTEIQRLQTEPIGERELQKVKNQALANSVRRLQSNLALLIQLAVYDSNDDWRYINQAPKKLQAVTAAQIQEVARKYFGEDQRNTAIYLRKAGTEIEDPALANMPPQMKSMVQQQLQQIEKIENPSQLRELLSQVQQATEQALPEAKPALEFLSVKIQERIEQLSAESDSERPSQSGQGEDQ